MKLASRSLSLCAVSLLFAWGFAFRGAQDDLALMSNAQIADKVKTLASEPNTYDEQVRLVWVLVMRSAHGDKEAHRVGRPLAERLRQEDEFNYWAGFAFGYCRIMEGFDTRDLILRRRRFDEGKRPLSNALTMGSRDGRFLFDAGLALASMPAEADLTRSSLNVLSLAKRELKGAFGEMPAERQAEWYSGMGAGLARFELTELAREYYTRAYELAPESEAGRKAAFWLRGHGGWATP